MKRKHIQNEAIVLFTVVAMIIASTAAVANTEKFLDENDFNSKEVWLGNNPSESTVRGEDLIFFTDDLSTVYGTSAPPWWMAIRLDAAELTPYDGWEIVESAWYHYSYNQSIPTHDYDIRIYEGNSTHWQTMIVNETDTATNPDGWANHTFTNSYTIDASKNIYIVAKVFVADASLYLDYCLPYNANASHYIANKTALYHTGSGGQNDSSQFGDLGYVASNPGAWWFGVKVFSPSPELSVDVKGGIGLTATITNDGDAAATNVEATFTISGGLMLLPSGGTKTVAVGDIAINGSGEAKCFVLGIGAPTVTVDVTCDEGVTASATYNPKFVLLFFVL